MKPAEDEPREQRLLAQLIEAIGRDDFKTRAFELVDQVLAADHIVVYCVVSEPRRGDPIRGIFTEGRLSARVAHTINQRYIERYYVLDKNLSVLHELRQDPPTVLRLDPEDSHSSLYKQYFYGRTGLCDKLSIVSRRDGRLLLCNLYRLTSSGRFGMRQMARAQQLAPVLTACVWRHMAWMEADGWREEPRPASHLAAQVETGQGLGCEPDQAHLLLRRLSNRETDICRRLLAGASNEGTALDLGISVHTVRTLRKRLYKKLQVNSLGDLYARYLSAMAGQVGGRA